MKRGALATVLALLVCLYGAVPSLAEPLDGVVNGTLINKTAGGGSTAGVNVVLVSFGRKEQAPVGQQTAQTDADGHFSFSGLDRDPNFVYLAVARYANVNYPSDQPFQLVEQANQQADISVYETTTTDDALQFESLNLLVMGANQGVMQVMQMGALVNSSDRTFVTANPQDQALARAVKFALPKGALGVQMQSGFSDQDVTAAVGGIQVTSPVLPGRHQFAMSFQVPYQGSSADVSLQIPYATGAYSVYVPDTGLKLDANGLKSAGATQMGGQSFTLYSASNVPRATMMAASLSGLASNGAVGPNQLGLISLGVVVFVLGAGVLVFGARRRPVTPAEPDGVEVEHERLELVVRMAALDERYAAGEVDLDAYAQERERGKQRLRELTLTHRGSSST